MTLSGLIFSEADAQERLVDAALNQFPVIGDRLKENLQSLPNKSLGFGVGLAGALWAGLGGMKAAQNAMDHIWNVPMRRQPSCLVALGRASLMLVTLGLFILLASFLGGVAAGTEDAPVAVRVAGVVGTAILNFLVFWSAFRVLTVESAAATYGFFAVVIGLLTWMYLGAQLTLLATEVNVVRARRFWQRALSPDDMTDTEPKGVPRPCAGGRTTRGGNGERAFR